MSKKSRENKAKRNELETVDAIVTDVIEKTEARKAKAKALSPLPEMNSKNRAKVEVIVVPDGCKSMSAAYKALERSKKAAALAKDRSLKALEKAALAAEKAEKAALASLDKEVKMKAKEAEKADKAVETLAALEAKLEKQLEAVKKTRDAIKDTRALIKKAEKAKAETVVAEVVEA